MRCDRPRLLGGGDDDRQAAGGGVRLHLGQQRQTVLDPGIDQDDRDASCGQRRRGLIVAVAQGKLAAPAVQARANALERLVRPLQHEDPDRLSHTHALLLSTISLPAVVNKAWNPTGRRRYINHLAVTVDLWLQQRTPLPMRGVHHGPIIVSQDPRSVTPDWARAQCAIARRGQPTGSRDRSHGLASRRQVRSIGTEAAARPSQRTRRAVASKFSRSRSR